VMRKRYYEWSQPGSNRQPPACTVTTTGRCYYYAMRYTSERATDPGLLVLASLAEGPKHGYAITSDVEQMAGVNLGPGTLYGALSRLEARGLIEALPAEGRRRPYRLTGAGRVALAEELQTLERVARDGLARLRTAGATA
jgi:DNA-binding PadR family transcriptional regulator